MRTLILGGSGLISTETARACMEMGHETIALTRGKTPFRVMDAAGRSLMAVVADRKDKAALKKVISDIRPEAIIDLICYEKQDMEDLIGMRNSALKHLIFVSTVCVFGGPLAQHPARGHTERRPNSSYGQKKKEIEDLCLDVTRSGSLACTIFRPSSTDGPGAWMSGNLWGRDATLFTLLLARRPVIVCAGGVLCQHGSTRDVGRALALSLGRQVCIGRAYQVVGDECVTQAEFIRRAAAGIGVNDPNIVEIPADWLCQRLKDWKRVGFLRDIWRYHCSYNTSELKRDLPEWKVTSTIAENAKDVWRWARDGGTWTQAQAGGVFKTDLDPEPICDAYERAHSAFLA